MTFLLGGVLIFEGCIEDFLLGRVLIFEGCSKDYLYLFLFSILDTFIIVHGSCDHY